MSLLTGFAAASLMMYARVGFLRTLPPPAPRDVQRLHRTAHALGIEWPAELLFADFIRGLDAAKPQHAAMISACTRLLRGSGYVAFDGETPAQPLHSALDAEYAHVTAPLRRLGDRYASEICVALCAGTEVPDWVRAALPDLAKTMQESSQRANRYERMVLDLVEAGLLQHRVGESFAARRGRGEREGPDARRRDRGRPRGGGAGGLGVGRPARHRRPRPAHHRRRRAPEGRVHPRVSRFVATSATIGDLLRA